MENAIKRNGIYESIGFYNDLFQTHGKGTIQVQAKLDGNDEFATLLTIPGRESKITKLDYLPEYSTIKLTSTYPFSYTVRGYEPKYLNKTKLENYLYEIEYGNLDYPYAFKYFKPSVTGGCSSIRNGNIFGRNFDWLYNNQVQFIVHTPTTLEYYSVLGVSGIIPGVEQSNVEDDDIIVEGVDMFKLVPFYLLDGINERGLFCTHNIVPLDDPAQPTTEILAQKEERFRVCVPMLPRFILDRFSTAKEAIDYLRDYVTLYFSSEMIDSGYQSHVLLGDAGNTYVLEFINGEMKVLRQNYITNFNISDVILNKDNTIKYPPTLYGIAPFGSGLERWNMIAKGYSTTRTHEGMRTLLDSIAYSNCYGEPFWTSELVKLDDDFGNPITVDTSADACSDAISDAREKFRDKDRSDPKVWITCHSSVYDLSQKTLWIKNQENEIEYKIEF